MTQSSRYFLLLALCLGLSFATVACGDDDSSDGDSGTTTTATTGGETTGGTTGDTTPTGTSNNNTTAGPTTGGPTTGGPPVRKDEFAETEYPYSIPATYVNSIVIETDGSVGADVDGDGSVDNALGQLLAQLGPLLGGTDINDELATAIAEGDVALGMTWFGFADGFVADQEEVNLHFFLLQDTDGDPSTSDEFVADPASFEPGTDTPVIQFNGASVTGGSLKAGPSLFALAVDFAGINLNLEVAGALFAGDASADGSGVAVTNGELSGAVPLSAVVDALNDYVSSDNCSCLGLAGQEYITGSGNSFSCGDAPDTSTCADADQDTCATIVQFCGTAVNLVGSVADIDTDNNGENDAISLFLRLEGSGTVITGVGE